MKVYLPTESPGAAMTLRSRLSQLRELVEQYGMAHPTAQNGADPPFIRWAARQRALRRQGNLPGDVIAELDAVGFVWDP